MFCIRRVLTTNGRLRGGILPRTLSNGSANTPKNGSWNTFKVAATSILGTTFALLGVYVASKKFSKDAGELLLESIPPALDKARVTSSPSEGHYVCRPDVEAKINNFLSQPNNFYYVVYGAIGAGNSEVVDHTAIGKRAVVRLPVTTIRNRDHLVALVVETLTGKEISLDIDKLIEVLKKHESKGVLLLINVVEKHENGRGGI